MEIGGDAKTSDLSILLRKASLALLCSVVKSTTLSFVNQLLYFYTLVVAITHEFTNSFVFKRRHRKGKDASNVNLKNVVERDRRVRLLSDRNVYVQLMVGKLMSVSISDSQSATYNLQFQSYLFFS